MSESQESKLPTSSTHGTKRRRAARACLSCRTRKVRCDVSRSGPPCVNCSLDGIECVVKARKPKTSSRNGLHSTQDPNIASPECDNESGSPDTFIQQATGPALDTSTGNAETGHLTAKDHQYAIPEDHHDLDFAYGDRDTESPPEVETTAMVYEPTVAGPSFIPAFPDDNWFSACVREPEPECPPTEIPARYQRALHPNTVVYHYYPFLELNNLYDCLPQDVDFMEAEGCFHLPTRPIMDQIIRQYFLHVHPLLPLLNEGDFWELYYNKRVMGENRKMSLLVFQAIMFASCNFVNWSLESAKTFGYNSIRNLRAAFYRRAKLLYDFGAESSPLAIAQAALLLSHWTPPIKTEMKPNTVWLSIAIQNAKNAEAPYYTTLPASQLPTSKSRVADTRRQNELKRLWWCCIIRDRILPLGLRRGIQITRAHFDFEKHQPLGILDLEDEVHRSLVYSPDAKRDLIRVLSHVIQLCVILTDILLLVFPLDGALDQTRGRQVLLPLEEAEIYKSKQALLLWYKQATSEPSGERNGAEIDWNKHESVILYTNLMYTYYHSARMALYHYELQHYLALVTDTSSMDNKKIHDTRDAIQNAFSNITENLRGLNQRQLTRWLPVSMVAYAAFPFALHILNIHLSASIARRSPPNEATLMEVMKSLHLQYDGVYWVVKLVRQLVQIAQDDAASTVPGGRGVADWSELLTVRPKAYLRMSLAMDFSMSSGRFPDKNDLMTMFRDSRSGRSEKALRPSTTTAAAATVSAGGFSTGTREGGTLLLAKNDRRTVQMSDLALNMGISITNNSNSNKSNSSSSSNNNNNNKTSFIDSEIDLMDHTATTAEARDQGDADDDGFMTDALGGSESSQQEFYLDSELEELASFPAGLENFPLDSATGELGLDTSFPLMGTDGLYGTEVNNILGDGHAIADI